MGKSTDAINHTITAYKLINVVASCYAFLGFRVITKPVDVATKLALAIGNQPTTVELNGRPREIVLTLDFETYGIGHRIICICFFTLCHSI